MKRSSNSTSRGMFCLRWTLSVLVILSAVLTGAPVAMAAPQTPVAVAWTAYNDSAWQSGQSNPTNTTTILGISGTGTLKNFDTGALTGVTATFTSNGSPTMYANNGAATNSGTDAYSTFNGKANMTGVVNYGSSSGWYIDLSLTGLNPARTYTFATTANRNDSSYTTRVSRYTISGVDAATNASTSGTSLYNGDPYAVYFVTGYNTVNGYVARWTGIQPGSDGSFKVRAQSNGSVNEAYGFSVFMLSEDASTDPTITTTGTLSAFTSQPGVASAEQSYTVSAVNLTENLVITAPTDFQISTTSGSGFGSSVTLTQSGGNVASTTIYVRFNRATEGSSSGDITHASAGATTQNVAVSGKASNCTTVNLTAAEDSYLSANDVTYNNGGNTEIHVNGTTSTDRRTALLKWDLSSIPSNATVSSASISLYITDASTVAYSLYNMRRTWVEGTSSQAASSTSANWNTYDGVNSWGTVGVANTSSDRYDTNLWGATTSSFSTVNSSATVALNTSGVGVVQGWIAGTTSNYGVIIQNYAGSTNTLYFSSSEATTAANRPKLNVTYCASTSPTINTSGALTAFNTQPGVPSAAQTYTVSGSNLTENIVITPPAGFELSTDGSTYNSSVTLTQSGGSVASTTIHVRLYSATEGTFSGNITHTSSGATTKNVAASGTVSNSATVNLTAAEDTYLSANDVTYNNGGNTELHVDATTGTSRRTTLLKWDVSSIPSNATVSAASLSLYVTDASPLLFNLYNMRRPWVEGTGTRTASTTSANWNTYDGSTSWGTVGAANTSSDRYDTNLWSATTSSFSTTGSKTEVLNTDGMAVVQGWIAGTTTNYGLTMQNFSGSTSNAVYFSSSEATTTANRPILNITYCAATGPTIITTSALTAFSSSPGVPSQQQSYTVAGGNLSADIVVTAPADFEISTTSESGFGSSVTLLQSGGSVATTMIFVRFNRATVGTSSGNITHSSTDATTKNVAVSGTASTVNHAPNTPVLVEPSNGAMGVSTSPTLKVTVTDVDADDMDVAFYGRAMGGSSGVDFTIIAIPDTQNEAQYYPAILNTEFQWIANNKTSQNIVFATSLGDIVNTADNATQWQNADAAYDYLDAGNVAYSVGPGNHDLPLYTATSLYPTYFGASRFSGKSWYGGSYNSDNYNNYSLFNASGMDFILINLQYDPTSTQLDWADALLKANPSRRAIVEQHNILNTDNSWNSQASFNALKDNPNLFLMLCGHMHTSTDGAAYRAELGDDGHTIHIMMADYQDYPSGGNGYLRILRFSPVDDKIYATTYSPSLASYLTDSQNQFELAYDLGGAPAFGLIGTVTGVTNGGNASIAWPGRAQGDDYEWYAVVSDGSLSTTGATWSFTTAALPKAPVMQTIAVTGATKADVTLTWDVVTQDVNNNPTTIDNYRVLRSEDPYFTSGGSQRSTDPLTVTSFTDAGGAATMTNWYYLVRAHNGAGWGEGSSLARKVGKFTFGLTAGTP